MKYKRLVLGPLENNCFILSNDKEAVVIDVSAGNAGALKIKEYLDEEQLNLKGVYFTHGHFDHIDGAEGVRSDSSLHLNKEDDFLWKEMFKESFYKHIDYEEPIDIGGSKIDVLHTPGHTPGSTCYYSKELEVVFSGDTLFNGGPGATRWHYSDIKQLINSIENKLFSLPEDTKVWPGHGPSTTIAEEKEIIGRIKISLESSS